MALALVLLTGAGLLIRTFLRLVDVDLGIDPTNVITMGIRLPDYKYPSAAQQALFYKQLLQNLGNTPGVKSTGAEGGGSSVFFQPQGQPVATPDRSRPPLIKSSRPIFSMRWERIWRRDAIFRRAMPRARHQ